MILVLVFVPFAVTCPRLVTFNATSDIFEIPDLIASASGTVSVSAFPRPADGPPNDLCAPGVTMTRFDPID